MKKIRNKTLFIIIILFFTKQSFVFAQCWKRVSASSTHALAIQNNGTLWGWGTSGDLGIGIPSTPNYNSPIQIGTENDWAEISAGANFSFAIKEDGSLWVWGSYPNPVLGGNNTTNLTAYNPVQVGNDYNWLQISAGGQHAIALKSNNTLWAWGMSNMGQVGNGLSSCTFCPPIYQTIPVQIGNDSDWKQINAFQDVSVAIKLNGTLWCWGGNWPTLVNNGFSLNNTPTQIGTDTTWSKVDGGEYSHLVALKTDGTIWTWGYEITTDTPFVVIPTPIQIGTDNHWIDINAGINHDMAIKNDSTIWSWGRNSLGQLGNGNVAVVQAQPQIILPSINNNFIYISGGNEYSTGMKSDGSLWAWGSNNSGQLGIGNNQNQATPQSVNCNALNITEQDIKPFVFQIYPNPSNGHLTIKLIDNISNVNQLRVFDVLGKEYHLVDKKVGHSEIWINVSNLSSGVYLLKFQTDDGKLYHGEFIKQ